MADAGVGRADLPAGQRRERQHIGNRRRYGATDSGIGAERGIGLLGCDLRGAGNALSARKPDIGQRLRLAGKAGVGLHHDVILVQSLIDIGDLALAKGIIQRVVYGVHGHAKARGRVAVNGDIGIGAAVLLVDIHVGNFGGLGLQCFHHAITGGFELFGATGLQDILVSAGGLASASLQVLHRVQEQRYAPHAGQLGAQAGDHIIDAIAGVARGQHDEHKTTARAATAGKRHLVLHRRVCLDDLDQLRELV